MNKGQKKQLESLQSDQNDIVDLGAELLSQIERLHGHEKMQSFCSFISKVEYTDFINLSEEMQQSLFSMARVGVTASLQKHLENLEAAEILDESRRNN